MQCQAALRRRTDGARRATATASGAGTPGSARSRCRSRAAGGQLLPAVAAGLTVATRAGVGVGRCPGLRRGRVDPPGRRPGAGDGDRRHLTVGGVAAGPSSTTRWPSSATGHSSRVPTATCGRHVDPEVHEGGRVVNVSAVIATAVDVEVAGRSSGSTSSPPSPRPLDRVPALSGRPRPVWRGARHLRRPRGIKAAIAPSSPRPPGSVLNPLHGQPRHQVPKATGR